MGDKPLAKLLDYLLVQADNPWYYYHARIQKVLSEGSNADVFFFWMRVEMIQIALKAGHHRPASEPAFECWLGSLFFIFQGIRNSIA